MFSRGQIIFGVAFFIVFVIIAIFVYRKDLSLQRQQYKGSYRVLIVFLLFVALLFAMKHYLKH